MNPRSATHRIPLAAMFDGKDGVTIAGTALLVGIPVNELLTALGDSRDAHDLPHRLKQSAHRRCSEARSRSDSEHPGDLFYYWAHGMWEDRVGLTHDLEALEIWLTTDDPAVAGWFGIEANS